MHIVIAFILALLLRQTLTIRCYICEDCGESEGALQTCPVSSNADSCLLSTSSATGKVTKSCGEQQANSNLLVGCISIGYFGLCRCLTDACNTNAMVEAGVTSRSTTTIPTTTRSDPPPIHSVTEVRPQNRSIVNEGFPRRLGELIQNAIVPSEQVHVLTRSAWYCYRCIDCGTSVGVLTNCASQTSWRFCIYSIDIDGKINRYCGSDSLEEQVEYGCNTLFGWTYCKCAEPQCNRDPFSTTTPRIITTQAFTTPSVRTNPATTTQSVVRTQATTTQNNATTQASTDLSLSHLPIWTCYSCYDCKESTGKLVNCSGEDAVKTCYHVTYPSGRILRSCGHAGVDIEIAQVGCRETHSGLTWCRCREKGCNKYPNMTEQVQETKSNASTVLSGEADQNGQEDEIVEISLQRNISFGMNISTSNASTLPFNMSNSSNFESELDEMFNFTSESAKNSINNFTATDILINNTNNSSSFTSSTLHVTTTEVLHDFRLSESTTRITQETVTADDMDADVTSTAAQVEEGESLFCYSCTECGRSAGNLIDCSLFHESRHCTLVRKPNGQVSRSCGLESDQFHLPGCNTTFGWTMCVCFEDGCNEYPDIIDDRTTFPPTMVEVESTTRSSLFFCRLCFDCGEGTGISFPCAGVSSCSLTITQNRIVRDCGSTETDLMVPEGDACVTLDNFDVMCKCSTENCNIYPELTASG